MIQPSFQEFEKLAKQGNLIPVYDVFSADLLTPVSAYLRVAQGARYSFLAGKRGGRRKDCALHFRRRKSRRDISAMPAERACWKAATG